MDSSEVDYDAYDLSEFTDADFVYIDSTTREHPPGPDSDNNTDGRGHGAQRRVEEEGGSGGPQVAVELECAADEYVVVKVAAGSGTGSEEDGSANESDRGKSRSGRSSRAKEAHSSSPYKRYRSSGYLSVSDLVRPAWCEMQYDYGLRQGRSRPLADRPDTFVSAGGRVITVDKKVAEVNEEVLENGRVVHKELERELHPEQVVFIPETAEELWAARLIDMLARLDTLMQEHCCREMPVFGVVQDYPIIGIIDEISLKTIPEPKAEPDPRRKRAPTSAQGTPRRSSKRRELSPSQSHVTDFFTSPSKANRSPSPIRPMYELSLKDTKTRRSKWLPSDDDALSSRLQLMLYHHLLSELLSPTFSFSTFWEKVHVNPFEPFSDKFLRDFGLAREADGIIMQGYPDCLDDLADFWRLTVQSYPLQSISPTLEITYRTQPKRSAAPRLSPVDVLGPLADADQEERDLQRAIVESLRDMNPGEESGAALDNGRISIATSRSPSPRGTEKLSDTLRMRWYDRSGEIASTQPVTAETARPARALNTAEPRAGLQASTSQPESSNIIGRKTFDFDEAAMQAHVRDVLQWWRGERPPRGVEVEHSRRCFSCEYKERCEWREKKAREAQETYLERKFF